MRAPARTPCCVVLCRCGSIVAAAAALCFIRYRHGQVTLAVSVCLHFAVVQSACTLLLVAGLTAARIAELEAEAARGPAGRSDQFFFNINKGMAGRATSLSLAQVALLWALLVQLWLITCHEVHRSGCGRLTLCVCFGVVVVVLVSATCVRACLRLC